MRNSRVSVIAAIVAVSFQSLLNAEEVPAAKLSPRDALRVNAGEFVYPGGMLFHTAFHHGYTTRFLLLKAALQSDELSKFFALDETQRMRVKKLQCAKVDDAARKKMLDKNAQPDEQLIDPDYFAFLRAEQLRKLDVLAVRFDGYMALTRKSVAERLGLSPRTREKIATAAAELREALVLPRFRWEFAAKLPKDIGYRDCLFAASAGTRLNLTIADALTDDECQRVVELFQETLDAADTLKAAEDAAVLPDGVHSLINGECQDE